MESSKSLHDSNRRMLLLTILISQFFIGCNADFVGWDDYYRKWQDEQYKQAGRMYPYGTDYLDSSASREQRKNGFDPGVSFNMRYFGRIYTSLFVSVHGHVALFETSPAQETYFRSGEWPNPLYPEGGTVDPAFIGVYYANTDFRISQPETTELSRIFYRVMHKTSGEDSRSRIDNGMLELYTNDIRTSVIGAENIVAQHALQVTWYQPTFSGAFCQTPAPSADTCYRNTYQLALVITEDGKTFTIINYYNVTWLGGPDMGCNPLDGQYLPTCDPAKVGFNLGEARGFHAIPYSGTADLLNIDVKGGSNVPGRFFFQVSDARLVRGGCTNDTSLGSSTWELQVTPEFSEMFGGKELTIAGPCFLSSENIICKFGETRVSGSTKSGIMRATCVSPPQAVIGDTTLSVSIDGGYHYFFSTEYIIGYMGRADRRVMVSPAQDDWLTPETMQITWDPAYLGSENSYVQVTVFGYHEGANKQMRLDNLGIVVSNVRNTGSHILVPSDSPCTVEECSTYDLGAIQIKVIDSYIKMYSDVIPLGWYNQDAMRNYYGSNWQHERCRRWNSDDVTDLTWRNSLWPCPCTLNQALADFGRFQPDSYCDINSMHANSCKLHKGAVHCVRSVLITSRGSGTHCCYDSTGELMYSGDSVFGSTPDKAHTWGKPPYGSPPYIPSVSHWAVDLIPYYLCCAYQPESDYDCFNYFVSLRLTTDCQGYNMPGFAGVFGDPHFRTFDGTNYTYNGHGEFWLLMSDTVDINGAETSFGIQGRFEQVNYTQWGTDVKVSVLTAVAIKEEGKSTVELRLATNQQYDKIAVFFDGRLLTFPHFDVSWQDFADLVIINHNSLDDPMRTNFTVAYRSGFGVQVSFKNGLLHLIASIPPQLYNHVRGLLGDWNGSPGDDLRPRDGGQSVPADDLSRIHYSYGWTWATSASESFFTYASKLTHDYYMRQDFTPVLTWPSTGLGNCGDDMACNFDYQNTKDSAVATDTLNTNAWISQLQFLHTQERQTCGWLNVLNAVRQEPISYYVGSTVVITGCRHGFTLEGPTVYSCQLSSTGDPVWTPTITTRCIDNANIKATKQKMAMAIGIPVCIVFLILFIGLIAAICYCVKKRKTNKAIKEESYRGDMKANDEFLTEFHAVKGETKRPDQSLRPPRPAYHPPVPATDYPTFQDTSLNSHSRKASTDIHNTSRDSVDALLTQGKKKPRAPYRYPNMPEQSEGAQKRPPYQYPKSTQVLTIDEIMAINKIRSDSFSDA